MFKKLSEQLKANPRTIVFTEGTDARILEAADKLTAEEFSVLFFLERLTK